MTTRFFFFAALLSTTVGCAAASDRTTDDPTYSDESALQGGCHTECPKCHPGEVCPMIACRLVCNGHEHTTCVDTVACMLGYHWSSAKCACVADPAKPGSCTTDADCRTFADYCTGCDCRALSTSEKDPTCSGPGVKCFADPCMNQTAVCLAGTCSLVSTAL